MSEEKKQYDVAKRTSALEIMAARLGCESGKLLTTLKATCFKGEVSNEQMMALTIVANQYQLNPFTKELYAFPDKGGGIVPVVGVDGWARIINEHEQFDGMEFEQDDEQCTCTIHRKDRAYPVQVTEYLAECKRNTGPWVTHPRRMLRHKAMIQCARLAFGYAGIYDQDEAERIVDGIASAAPYDAEPIKKAVKKADAQPAPEPEQAAQDVPDNASEFTDDLPL